jgi:LysR family transcriptional regulator, positive regulator for ilvC
MDFRALELFLNLASTLHFGKTGRMCHISTSALSRVIQRLEAEVGHSLFIRDNRSVELSDTGRQFRVFAQEVIDGWHQFTDTLKEEPGQIRGELLIYGSVTAANSVLANLFSDFRTQFPNIHIRLETGDAAFAIEKIQDGAADIAVAARPDNLAVNLHFRTLTSTPLVFVAPVVPCEVTEMVQGDIDWATVPMIIAEQALSRKRTEAWFRSIGKRPNIYAEVAGHEAIISMVRLGCGIGVVPKIVYELSGSKSDTRLLDVDADLPPYEVGLCVHKKRLNSPAVRAFWDIARDNA